MRNNDVARSWAHGRAARAANFWTDGRDLYSYNLKIGYTDDTGASVALDYTAPVGWFQSVTTSRHVSYARRYADRIETPQ